MSQSEKITIYKEFRTDGFPLCPACGEDELYSPLMLTWDGTTPRPSLDDCLEDGFRCYNCNFKQPNPNGIYPLCRPVVGNTAVCERCNAPRAVNQPCPSVPKQQRWGRDSEGNIKFGLDLEVSKK